MFLVSGLWHGANWTFVIWGSLHGMFLIIGRITHDLRAKTGLKLGLGKLPLLNKFIQVATTFASAAFAWIFFRAASFGDAATIIKNSATISKSQLGLYMLGTDSYNFILCFVFIAFMEAIHY